VIADFRSHFPQLIDLSFTQLWPGQIDMTRDLLPVIARPPEHPHSDSFLVCVEFPGRLSGEASPRQREFALPSGLGGIIGKPLLFSLSNTWAKFSSSATRCERERKRILMGQEKYGGPTLLSHLP
jgi:gamma-glutamylputrescine oxidase